jgi:hypothetical protein
MIALILAATIAATPPPSPPAPHSDPCTFSKSAQAKGTPPCTVDARPASGVQQVIPIEECAGRPKSEPLRSAGQCVSAHQRQADGSDRTVRVWQPRAGAAKP